MALKNRQGGEVKIFVGTDKLSTYAKNIIEFDELALKTYITKALLLTTLGIPTYVDQTAANAALAAGVVYYNTATAKVESATS